MEHCFWEKNCEPQRPCKQTASFENKVLHGCMGSIDPNHCIVQICLECKKMCGQGLGDSVGDSVLRQRRAASSSGTGTQEFLSPSAAEDS